MGFYGFEKVFDKFCEINKATEGFGHDLGKVRDKFTEIIEAVGINSDLLKTATKIEDAEGKTIRGGVYRIPVESVDFCAQIIDKYTTKDFKNLRSASFRDVDPAELQFLYDGFSDYLYYSGYSREIILQQQQAMDRRMLYKVRLSEMMLKEQLESIKDLAADYEASVVSFNYDDSVYFIRYMAGKVKHLREYIQSVYCDYTDDRGEELYKLAEEEMMRGDDSTSVERINMELVYAYELEQNAEYQKLLKDVESIIAEDTFVKKKQGRFKKLQARLEEIRKETQHELFGELLPEEDEPIMTVRHPLTVLQSAIEYTDETISDYIDRELKEENMTQEEIEARERSAEAVRKFLEERGMSFDLPETDEEEEELLLSSSNLAYKIKGMIAFPCCNKEKIMVYEDSTGHSSNKCPRCGKYALFDFDKMEATEGEALRGAAHRFRDR